MLAVACAACSSEPDAGGTVVSVPVATTSTVAPPTPTATTTNPEPSIPPEHLDSCVEFAKFQAFSGNEFWVSMWRDADETDAGMREVCSFLAEGDLAWLAGIHDDWQALLSIAPPPTTDESVSTPDASLVRGCVDWVNWYVLVGDPDVVAEWGEAAESPSTLSDACAELASESPGRARAMGDETENIVRLLNES